MAGINPLFKNCEICDGIFYKRDRYSYKQWKSRRCCSKKCAAILIGNIKRRPVIDRFMEKIKSVDSGCIEWQGYKNKQGYGYMTSRRGSSPYSSHRLSYELFVGEIPDGMWVLHKCDNPPCVNPKHLFIGTRQDNIDDMVSKNRQQRVSRAGEDSHTAILKQEDVDKIRSLYGTGKYTYQELADIYPVKKCTLV